VVGMQWQCDVARFDERVIVGVRGAVDLATAPDFERELLAELRPGLRGLVIDLAYCTVLDPAGISALERLRDHAQELCIEIRLTSIPRTIETQLRSSALAAGFAHGEHQDARLTAP